MGYQYKGKQAEPASPKCGSRAGYMDHVRLGTAKCQPCKDAHAAYQRKWTRRPQMRTTCGTYPGYMRHKRAGEYACDMCKEGYARYMRDYREKKMTALMPVPPTPPTLPERLKQAAELFADGASQREVHRSTGLNRETLRKYFPGQGWTYEQAGEFRALTRRYEAVA